MAQKKRNSKIINPKNDDVKTVLHAFRTDEELAEMLGELPNKSEFIVEALKKAFYDKYFETCPSCKGTGQILKRG